MYIRHIAEISICTMISLKYRLIVSHVKSTENGSYVNLLREQVPGDKRKSSIATSL